MNTFRYAPGVNATGSAAINVRGAAGKERITISKNYIDNTNAITSQLGMFLQNVKNSTISKNHIKLTDNFQIGMTIESSENITTSKNEIIGGGDKNNQRGIFFNVCNKIKSLGNFVEMINAVTQTNMFGIIATNCNEKVFSSANIHMEECDNSSGIHLNGNGVDSLVDVIGNQIYMQSSNPATLSYCLFADANIDKLTISGNNFKSVGALLYSILSVGSNISINGNVIRNEGTNSSVAVHLASGGDADIVSVVGNAISIPAAGAFGVYAPNLASNGVVTGNSISMEGGGGTALSLGANMLLGTNQIVP
jgi:hypothetical protein